MRAYELMIIFEADLEDSDVKAQLKQVNDLVEAAGGTVHTTDQWGKRRFAYEINHKVEGIYAVLELTTDGGDLSPLDRFLRLADTVIRHKLLRLPDKEAARRGLYGADAIPASAKPADEATAPEAAASAEDETPAPEADADEAVTADAG
jgi:small subunit ribosomal protein S6